VTHFSTSPPFSHALNSSALDLSCEIFCGVRPAFCSAFL
jgi:hypothetical protein